MATMQGVTPNDSGLQARTGWGSLPLPPDRPLAAPSALDRLMASPAPLDRFAPPPSYTVRAGDTLSGIAARFGTDVATLARGNGIADPDRITPGQTLRLPEATARGTHIVQPGDTLDGIARAAGTSWQSLARLNGLADPDRIQPGQVLVLHGEGASRTATTRAPASPPAVASVMEPSAARPATGDHRLGSLSERYETSGRGPGTVSSGANDPGGVSYGVYQLSTNAGTLQSFLRAEGRGWAGELSGAPGGANFSAQWRAIAAREPQAFREAQHAFIERTHYQPAVDRVRDATGLDLASRHDAVRDAAWSTGVQHGRAAQLLTTAIERTDAAIGRDGPGYDRQLIQNIYAERTSYLQGLANSGRYSAGEAQQLRDITQTRYPAELRDALAMIDRAAPATPAPAANGTEAERLAALIETHGDTAARADLAAGRKVLVAVRTDTGTGANGGRGTYDDRMALVWRDGTGTLHARGWDGNTEPAGRYAARGYGVDVDGDGRKELGRLVEGSYRYTLQPGSFAGNRFFRADAVQPALRDSNHDGRFTTADRTDRTGAGRSLLIHQGGNSATGSAGCQTLRPADYAAFLAQLGGQTRFSYVLVGQ